jgi:hypothetical protein
MSAGFTGRKFPVNRSRGQEGKTLPKLGVGFTNSDCSSCQDWVGPENFGLKLGKDFLGL